jgi:hypothetical protein
MLCECVFSLILASKHFGNENKLNEFNPGIIVENKDGIVVMAYRNSHFGNSAGIGFRYSLRKGREDSLSIVGGVITGYTYPVLAAFWYKRGDNNFLFAPGTRGRFTIAYARSL